MYGNILINDISAGVTLEDAAKRLFAVLAITDIEERESANHIDDHYFKGVAVGIEVTIARSDVYPEYDYWMNLDFTMPGHHSTHLNEHGAYLAALFLEAGYRCAIIEKFATNSEKVQPLHQP